MMTPIQIKKYLANYINKRSRTIVIVDFGNVEKWKNSLGWVVGIQELANLTKCFSSGQRFLRRFYYGIDYGRSESSKEPTPWSSGMITRAEANGMFIIKKRVKYIYSTNNRHGFEKKCDLDVEMTIDLVRERENYDTIVLFSGDGDLAYAINYLHQEYNKNCVVFGARDHVGREIFDAKITGSITDIFFAEDFEYRLKKDRKNY